MTTDQQATEIKARDGAAVWREIDGETVLLALDSSRYLGANRSGTALWAMMVDGTTRDAMIDRLVETYGIPAERAAADVDKFVGACRDHHLLIGS